MNTPPEIGSDSWEYRLTVYLLKEPMDRLTEKYRAALQPQATSPTVLRAEECIPWITQRLEFLVDWSKSTAERINREFPEAWGAPGVEGDEKQIRNACSGYLLALEQLVDWERGIGNAAGPNLAWKEILTSLRGTTVEWFEITSHFPYWMDEIVNNENSIGPHAFEPLLQCPRQLKQEFLNRVIDAYRSTLPFWKRHIPTQPGLWAPRSSFFGAAESDRTNKNAKPKLNLT